MSNTPVIISPVKSARNTTGKLNCLLSLAAMVVIALWVLSGCATKPAQKQGEFMFFPTPPNPPRVQFLTSFSSEEQLRGGFSTFATYVTGETEAKNPILKPYGVAIKRNKLYVCDTALNAVLILDLEKKRMIGLAPRGEAILKEPLNITVDDDGSRYIVDTMRNQVLIFDANDRYQGAIGEKDEMKPRDVAVTKDRLYVADIKNHCVRTYDKASRKLLGSIPQGKDVESIATRLFQPTNLAVDRKGFLNVCDTGAFRVQQYDAAGNYVRSIGKNGDSPGEFKMPKGIAVDREGRVYVVDAANQVVQIFDDQARLLMWFGNSENGGGLLDLPAKVIIDYDHVSYFQKYAAPGFRLEYLIIVTNQYGPRKVSVFGFGEKK
jgi:DNA-binding beta-propeller fold protein YncE